MSRIPIIGKPATRMLIGAKNIVKTLVYGSNWFEDLGFYYLGPVDGHDMEQLCDVLERAKKLHRPVFLHVETQKGKGYCFAEENPGEYHGTSGFDIDTGKSFSSGGTNFSNEFGLYLTELGRHDKRICAITAAMKYGTGLNYFSREFRQEGRFYDVGIAEPHAVTFAGGLAANGMVPVFAVYSSFLQRCYDEIIHDLSIEEQHVVIGIDRAGIVGNDGETHQGLFDVAMLANVPKITVYSPANYEEMRRHLYNSIYKHNGVCCVRYPRGGEVSLPSEFDPNRDWQLFGEDTKTVIVTYGRISSEVFGAVKLLGQKGISVSVLKLGRILPLPKEAVSGILQAQNILFVEEGIKNGGIGQMLGENLLEQGYKGNYRVIAVDNCFVDQATVSRAIQLEGMDAQSIAQTCESWMQQA